MAARAGAGRSTDWLSVWLSEGEGSGTAVSWQYSTPLTCIDFSLDQERKLRLLARLQALRSDFPRSEHAVDLGKCGAEGIRTPGLLHAMQLKRPADQDVSLRDLRNQCIRVPRSTRQSVGDGCPLGCPLMLITGCSSLSNTLAGNGGHSPIVTGTSPRTAAKPSARDSGPMVW